MPIEAKGVSARVAKLFGCFLQNVKTRKRELSRASIFVTMLISYGYGIDIPLNSNHKDRRVAFLEWLRISGFIFSSGEAEGVTVQRVRRHGFHGVRISLKKKGGTGGTRGGAGGEGRFFTGVSTPNEREKAASCENSVARMPP